PIPAAASAVTAWAETDRFGLAGFAAWGMKPDAFTWLASHAAAYWASVFGSLLGGNAIAGAATANTRPAARRNVTTLFIGCPSARAAATGMDSPTGIERSQPANHDGVFGAALHGYPGSQGHRRSTDVGRQCPAYGCGSAPEFDRTSPAGSTVMGPRSYPVSQTVRLNAARVRR